MKWRFTNPLLLVVVLLICVAPLFLHASLDKQADFAGADTKAQAQIVRIAPNYKPWFKPIFEPASGEISTLLFALQAAAGAGVMGYWLGAAMTRERLSCDRCQKKHGPEEGATLGCSGSGNESKGRHVN